MPKVSVSRRLHNYMKEYGESVFTCPDYRKDELFCNICAKFVACKKKSQLKQHVSTDLHTLNLEEWNKSGAKKQKLTEPSICYSTNQEEESHIYYCSDLCNAFASAGIPLWKLSHPAIRTFLATHTKFGAPDESTLREYVPQMYDTTMARIRSSLTGKRFWISVDETLDKQMRCFVNVVVGVLDPNETTKPYLVNVGELEKVNHTTICCFVDDTLRELFTSAQFKRENFLLFVTDGSGYMVKAGSSLKVMYPKMIHVTCLAHGVSQVAECVSQPFPLVDKLISDGHEVFCTPSRNREFRNACPTILPPPEPIVTKWCTWLRAAIYYASNFDAFREVVSSFPADDAHSIAECMKLFNHDELIQQLAFLKMYFACIDDCVTTLEKSDLPLSESISCITVLCDSLTGVPDACGIAAREKLDSVLAKNDGYTTLRTICEVQLGNLQQIPDYEFDAEDLAALTFAPITSCDVERTFSVYKNVLSDRDRHLSSTPEHLKMIMVIWCNFQRPKTEACDFTSDDDSVSFPTSFDVK